LPPSSFFHVSAAVTVRFSVAVLEEVTSFAVKLKLSEPLWPRCECAKAASAS
jgi:hypothetical protein